MKGIKFEMMKSNQNLIKVGVLCLLVIIISIYGQGFNKNTQIGTIIIILGFLFTLSSNFYTNVIVNDKNEIVTKEFLSFGFRVDIRSISKIERNYEFIFKSWGCRMELYYTDEYNFKQVGTIQESIYDIEDIKELLKTLKKINTSIKLHHQYQDLIDGKIEDEDGFKGMKIE